MIQITRQIARQICQAWKRLAPRSGGAIVELKATESELIIRLHRCEILAEYALAGSFEKQTITLPFNFLVDVEGRDNSEVSISQGDGNNVQVQWNDKDLPCSKDYEGLDPTKLQSWPKRSAKTSSNDKLMEALLRASASTAKNDVRYALTHLQLRGETGEVVGTNGTELFIEKGFAFPWKDNLLIPNVNGLRNVHMESLWIGRVENHVALSSGPWTFWLPIAKEARFPDYENVLPMDKHQGELQVVSEDAEFAVKALPRLPGADAEHSPVTMDLNGEVIIRAAESEKSKATELVLSGSRYDGTPMRFQIDRNILKRAFELGCTRISLFDKDRPLVSVKNNQRFVFMSLGKANALAPNASCVRVMSPTAKSKTKPRKQTVTTTKTEETTQVTQEPKRKIPASLSGLIAETKALCEDTRLNCRRAVQILAGLKRHSKKTKLMQSTLKSLHQLQKIGD